MNSELVLTAESTLKAEELKASFDNNLKNAVRIGRNGKPVPGTGNYIRAPFKKRLIQACIRFALLGQELEKQL